MPLATSWWRWSKLDSATSPGKMSLTFCGTFDSNAVAPGLEASSFDCDRV